jgi:hypothetical protein
MDKNLWSSNINHQNKRIEKSDDFIRILSF